MKKIKILISLFACLLLNGCGHSLYHKVEGTGLYGRIPTPNGSSLIQVAIGDMNITSGILRGGATLDQNTSKGGTFGSVSLGRHTHVSTIPSVNEGYIENILTSKDTDAKTKQLIALYLITRNDVKAPASAVTSVNAGSATGNKNEIPQAKPTKVGFDNIVEKTGDTITNVAPVVKDGTVKVSKSFQKSIVEGTNNWKKIFDNISIISIAFSIVIIILALFVFLIIKSKKNQQI